MSICFRALVYIFSTFLSTKTQKNKRECFKLRLKKTHYEQERQFKEDNLFFDFFNMCHFSGDGGQI